MFVIQIEPRIRFIISDFQIYKLKIFYLSSQVKNLLFQINQKFEQLFISQISSSEKLYISQFE